MRLTKYTHACIRLELAAGTLLIDPGVWSRDADLDGVDAVLVTHEHVDHIDVDRLADHGVEVYAPAAAAITGVDVRPVEPDETFTVAGISVRAVGGKHATIYGGKPDCANLGYVIDGAVYHPGDSLHVPQGQIDTLLVPAHASWLKTCEAIDFAKAVNPRRAHPIHDGQINERGLAGVNGWLGEQLGERYQYLSPGETVRLG